MRKQVDDAETKAEEMDKETTLVLAACRWPREQHLSEVPSEWCLRQMLGVLKLSRTRGNTAPSTGVSTGSSDHPSMDVALTKDAGFNKNNCNVVRRPGN
ncbi:unnamed protein product [Lampetra planeri]